MICPGCKTDNLAGKMLCYKCGTNLLQAPGEVPQEKKKKGGCWKGCLAGCLVVILIGIVTSIVFWINRDRVAEFFFDKAERAALSILSEEVDKEEVKDVMAEVQEALKKGELEPEKLKMAMQELTEYMADGELDKEETDRLMESFREAIKVEGEIAPLLEEESKK